MTLILASQSPRRKEILGYFTLPFECAEHRYDESSLAFEGDPVAYVAALAEGKAQSLVSTHGQHVILAADSIVFHNGAVLGKPQSEAHAFEILMSLSGSTHSVFSGVSLAAQGKIQTEVEETIVRFHEISEEQARRYHEAVYAGDKAAGYAIQEAGALIVRAIEGCYYNVMGLPINAVEKVLAQQGLSLWNHLPARSKIA